MIRRPSCVITVQYSHSTQSLLTFLSCSAVGASWSVWGSGGRGWADSGSCPGHWGPQGHHHYHHHYCHHHHDTPAGRGWIPGTGDGQSTRGRHSGVNKWTCQDKMLNLFLVKRIAWDRKCHRIDKFVKSNFWTALLLFLSHPIASLALCPRCWCLLGDCPGNLWMLPSHPTLFWLRFAHQTSHH